MAFSNNASNINSPLGLPVVGRTPWRLKMNFKIGGQGWTENLVWVPPAAGVIPSTQNIIYTLAITRRACLTDQGSLDSIEVSPIFPAGQSRVQGPIIYDEAADGMGVGGLTYIPPNTNPNLPLTAGNNVPIDVWSRVSFRSYTAQGLYSRTTWMDGVPLGGEDVTPDSPISLFVLDQLQEYVLLVQNQFADVRLQGFVIRARAKDVSITKPIQILSSAQDVDSTGCVTGTTFTLASAPLPPVTIGSQPTIPGYIVGQKVQIKGITGCNANALNGIQTISEIGTVATPPATGLVAPFTVTICSSKKCTGDFNGCSNATISLVVYQYWPIVGGNLDNNSPSTVTRRNTGRARREPGQGGKARKKRGCSSGRCST